MLIIRDPRGISNKFNKEYYVVSFDECIYLFTLMHVCKVYDAYKYT